MWREIFVIPYGRVECGHTDTQSIDVKKEQTFATSNYDARPTLVQPPPPIGPILTGHVNCWGAVLRATSNFVIYLLVFFIFYGNHQAHDFFVPNALINSK